MQLPDRFRGDTIDFGLNLIDRLTGDPINTDGVTAHLMIKNDLADDDNSAVHAVSVDDSTGDDLYQFNFRILANESGLVVGTYWLEVSLTLPAGPSDGGIDQVKTVHQQQWTLKQDARLAPYPPA